MPQDRLPRVAITLTLMVMLVLAGCGSPASDTVEPPTTPSVESSDAASSAATASPEAPTQTEQTERADPVAYVPWGPADPVIPEHYAGLARRDCDAAQSASPGGEFWDAVFAVCRTLTNGDPWPDLSAAPPPPQTDNPHDACLNDELEEMISAALAWHTDNGDDARPDVTHAESGSHCYRTLYETVQVPPEEDSTAPDPGQVTVAVVVDSTYDVTSVFVDGADVDDFSTNSGIGTRTISIHVPAPDAPTQVNVDLTLNENGSDRGTVSTTVEVVPQTDSDAP